MALALTCDCGAVSVTVPALPDALNACSCRYCARMGARWGYYPQADVTVTGATQTYRRAQLVLTFHRCPTCGCLMHWQGQNPGKMGVNMTQADPPLVAGIPVVDRFGE